MIFSYLVGVGFTLNSPNERESTASWVATGIVILLFPIFLPIMVERPWGAASIPEDDEEEEE